MRTRPLLAVHLLVWLIVPAIEIYLALAGAMRHAAWQYVLEVVAFGALGVIQWRYGKDHWLGSLLCPGFIVLLSALSVRAPADLLSKFLYVVGAVLLTTSFLRDSLKNLSAKVPAGFVFAILGTLGAWSLHLHYQIQDVNQRFGNQLSFLSSVMIEQLKWPVRTGPGPGSGASGPPVILVTVDTLRADVAADMESHRWLSARGRSWSSAMSTSSWTLPAVASIHTGLLPEVHGATCLYDSHCQGLSAAVPTLAEEFSGHGYTTVAFTANPWISVSTGLARGFQHFQDFASLTPFRLVFGLQPMGPHPQDAEVLVDAALAWLAAGPREGFMMWIHLIDPHMPYLHTPGMESITVRPLRANGSVSPEVREAIRGAYVKEVEHADGQLMRLLRALDERGFFAEGTLVFTSDHGEEFWEHGGIEHGHSHHGEVVEVPLVIAGPGFEPQSVSQSVASLLDIAPTLRASLGMAAEGVDLRQPPSAGRIALAYGAMVGPLLRSARDERVRAIVTGDPAFEPAWARVYDLALDPGEQAPRFAAGGDPVAQAALAVKGPDQRQPVEPNVEALRALGYAE